MSTQRFGRTMANMSASEAMQFLTKYACSQPGVLPPLNDWNVNGFYEDKFDDPWNFNLGENTVSLITAIFTSFSIVLIVDLLFRVVVRAQNGMKPQVVHRRLLLETVSSPISLLSYIVKHNPIQDPIHKPSTRTYVFLVFIGCLTVLIEFLFIFLATNQHKALNLRLDGVPIFEFEDRGCEFLRPPAFDHTFYRVPLTEKPGFDSRAGIQLFSESTGDILNPSRISNSSSFSLHILTTNVGDGLRVITSDGNMKQTQTTRMGVFLEQSGKLYHGMQKASSQQILSALLNRLERTNVTVLANFTAGMIQKSRTWKTGDGQSQLQTPSTLAFPTPLLNVTGASLAIDVRNVDLQETHLSHLINGEEGDFRKQFYMHSYLKDVMHSIMFPTGRGRGVIYAVQKLQYLDEDTTPLAYYNRPWIGVLPSLIICFTLLCTWVVVAAFGIEGDIDSQGAWEKYFKDTEESDNIDELEQIEDQEQTGE